MLTKVAYEIANEIADQFTVGFCNDRMVEDFAQITLKHLQNKTMFLEIDATQSTEPIGWYWEEYTMGNWIQIVAAARPYPNLQRRNIKPLTFLTAMN